MTEPGTGYFRNLKQLKQQQGLSGDGFYHYDTPMTAEHETEALKRAGFSGVRIMRNRSAVYTIVSKV